MPPIADEVLALKIFLSADGSQLEVRLMAIVSGDRLLIEQFQDPGVDIHSAIGHELTGWSIERIKVEKNTRRMCKNMIFGILYGLGRDGLYPYVVTKIRQIDGPNADLSGITRERLGKLYDKFFEKYTGVRAYMEDMRAQAELKGVVESIFGFRREIRKDDEDRSTYWGNQAVNSPIQQAAHALILMAMALLHIQPQKYNLLQELTMEVHDDLKFFVVLRTLPEAYKQLMELLTHGMVEYAERAFKRKLRVPILADATAGFTLGSMIKYAGEPVEEFLPRWQEKYRSIEAKGWKALQ